MATQRQIEANRRNAALSSVPKTASGKARSALNATRHSMVGASGAVDPSRSAEFEQRRALWEPEFAPEGEAAGWAFDRVVAASFRIEECERALGRLKQAGRERSELAWVQDRSVEAAEIYDRLDRDPMVAARRLEASFEGTRLLLEGWFALVQPLELGQDWSESETSKALDLLGVPIDARSRRTMITPHVGLEPVAFRLALAIEEIERLEAIRDEVMVPLEQIERDAAMDGDLALLSKPAKLVLRYEQDAWRRYREAVAELKAPKPKSEPVLAKLLPPPLAEIKPEPKPSHPPLSLGDGTNPIRPRRSRKSDGRCSPRRGRCSATSQIGPIRPMRKMPGSMSLSVGWRARGRNEPNSRGCWSGREVIERMCFL